MDIVRLLLEYGASLETLNSYEGTVLERHIVVRLQLADRGRQLSGGRSAL